MTYSVSILDEHIDKKAIDNKLVASCEKNEVAEASRKEGEQAHSFLNSMDYRTIKACQKVPEVKAFLEAEYPGLLEKLEEAREKAK